jgi:TonB family protein
MTTRAVGRGAEGALRVAVYWRERLIDVRPLEDSERGYARPGAEFEDGGLKFRVAALGDVERVPRGWPRRADLPFLLLVGGLLLAFGFSATLAVDAELAHEDEPMLTRAAATMSRTVFHLPPQVPQIQAHPRAADDREQVRVQPRRSDHRPIKAASAGMLGALEALGGSPVFERTGLHERINASLDRLSGAPTADAKGFSGINARHGGSGGPGGHLSIGGIGSSPRPAGGNALFANTGKKVEVDPDPTRTVVEGTGLPRDVVAKVIGRHLSQIRYCYESALQHAPTLAGKVAVLFTIDGAGNVAQADVAESSLGSSEVERCMLSRIQRWKFPEPKGGGVVSVSYPWVFKQAGTGDE